MSDALWRELDIWVKEYAGPLASSAENEICDIVGRIIAAEREACAKIASDMAANLELAGKVNQSHHINKAQLAAHELAHRIRARGDKT